MSLILTILFMFTGCNKQQENLILGQWSLIKSTGEYEFSLSGNLISIDNLEYDFSINGNILVISDDPSSDGFKATFSKVTE